MQVIAGPVLLAAILAGSGVAAEARQPPPAFTSAAPAGNPQMGHSGESPLRRSIARAIESEQPATPQAGSRQHDSLLNGVLIGAAVGGLLGLIPDYYDDCEECHDSLYASIAVGAGVGLLVDALRGNRGPAHGAVAPSPVQVDLTRRRVGIRAIVRWR